MSKRWIEKTREETCLPCSQAEDRHFVAVVKFHFRYVRHLVINDSSRDTKYSHEELTGPTNDADAFPFPFTFSRNLLG